MTCSRAAAGNIITIIIVMVIIITTVIITIIIVIVVIKGSHYSQSSFFPILPTKRLLPRPLTQPNFNNVLLLLYRTRVSPRARVQTKKRQSYSVRYPATFSAVFDLNACKCRVSSRLFDCYAGVRNRNVNHGSLLLIVAIVQNTDVRLPHFFLPILS